MIQATARVSVVPSVATELWAVWADIALEQRDLAAEGRAKVAAQVKKREPADLNMELHPSMVAIAAIATSIDGFATMVAAARRSTAPTSAAEQRSWMRRIRAVLRALALRRSKDHPVTEEPGSPDDPNTRAHYIWTILREAFDVGSKTNTWPVALKSLWKLRSNSELGLLHPKTIFGPPSKHPLVPGVTPIRALYTVETVDNAIALMRDIYATCRESCVRPTCPEALRSRMNGLEATLARLAGQ
jgi:hypothetical protein